MDENDSENQDESGRNRGNHLSTCVVSLKGSSNKHSNVRHVDDSDDEKHNSQYLEDDWESREQDPRGIGQVKSVPNMSLSQLRLVCVNECSLLCRETRNKDERIALQRRLGTVCKRGRVKVRLVDGKEDVGHGRG